MPRTSRSIVPNAVRFFNGRLAPPQPLGLGLLPTRSSLGIVLIAGKRRRAGLLLTPSSFPLLLISAAFYTPTLGLWSDSPNAVELLAGAAFLLAAVGVTIYLLPRVALVVSRSGVTPILRPTIPWLDVTGLVVTPNGASVLPSWVAAAVTRTGSKVLHATAGYSMRAVDRRRAELDAWRQHCRSRIV